MINGVGGLNDRRGPSPILFDTLSLFVHIDQLSCHCIFINYSNVHCQLIYLLRDDFLYYFCLLVELYETISQSIDLSV